MCWCNGIVGKHSTQNGDTVNTINNKNKLTYRLIVIEIIIEWIEYQ